jgi:DNA-binding response OmpR family regulator
MEFSALSPGSGFADRPDVPHSRILIFGAEGSDRLSQGLCLEGFECVTRDGCRATSLHDFDEPFELLIFDLRTMGDHAAARLASFRRQNGSAPLTLALVGIDQAETALNLLESGLDAYLRQPVGLRELVATARALLRRRQAPGPGLEIDVDRRLAHLDGEPLTLTEQEFQLLHLFARHPGRVFDRETLLSTLWGQQTYVALRTVDALIKRLRQRLDVLGAGHAYIQTVRGVGYRLAESASLPKILSLFLPLVTLLSQS